MISKDYQVSKFPSPVQSLEPLFAYTFYSDFKKSHFIYGCEIYLDFFFIFTVLFSELTVKIVCEQFHADNCSSTPVMRKFKIIKAELWHRLSRIGISVEIHNFSRHKWEVTFWCDFSEHVLPQSNVSIFGQKKENPSTIPIPAEYGNLAENLTRVTNYS